MNRLLLLFSITAFLSFPLNNLQSQNKIPFGEVTITDLKNLPYKPDPGADAIVLSDIGIATLNYDGDEFYVELVTDVKIRIVNSNGFDYASIDLPFSSDDDIMSYRASTFNLRNGEKTETIIPKKSFIIDNSTWYGKALKFNFPDVHEGSVIEYSYTVRLKDYAVNVLVPWEFQSDIPVVSSSLTVAYPENFIYKSIITGSSNLVKSSFSTKEAYFFRENVNVNITNWYVVDMPAFSYEPLIKSRDENITKINFELSKVNYTGVFIDDITPSYENLTKKLLEREDFGKALANTNFLKKKALELTRGLNDDLSKLKKIHEFVSNKILWNGTEAFMTSNPLKNVFLKEKGNSAEINLILMAMLRAVNIKTDPVILSTRSNGSINRYLAMIQQFNYVLAYVYTDDDFYLVDATDPLRPFNVLPEECLNDVGRLIAEYGSKFIDLRNNEKDASVTTLNLVMDDTGSLAGELKLKYSGINAYNIRKLVMLEGEDGFLDLIKEAATDTKITGFSIENLAQRDSDVIEKLQINIQNGTQVAGDKLLFNPFLSFVAEKSIFYQETRNYPIDFGAPIEQQVLINLEIPKEFSVIEKPADLTLRLGKNDGIYEFKYRYYNNKIMISSILKINKTVFLPVEYLPITNFYSEIFKKQAEMIVIKKNL
jgi:hypothetical protein